MKKIFLLSIFILLLCVPIAYGDTFTGNTATDWVYVGTSKFAKITITWLDAASADGVTGTIYFPDKLFGYLFYCAVTDPGATAPTDNYDIELTKANGEEVFDSMLINRDTATTETAWSSGYHIVDGDLTFTLSNQSEDNATGTLTIYLLRP